MADYKLALTTTADQDAALDWLLTVRNADAVHIDKPLADVPALLQELLQIAVEDAVPACQSARKASIATALDQATPEDWAMIGAQLKIDTSGRPVKVDAGAAVADVRVP